MDIQNAELILSEAIEFYISQHPQKKGDLIAAIDTIGNAQRSSAELLEQESDALTRAGQIVQLQNAIMNAVVRAYP
ncbi:MAG: hypothetical protein HGA41_09680 [Syntrophaceae bacterium]|nr:hypothetical protein [Syntrophaceae bacterium]NTW67222.1 hypothetical protein [Nitrospirota bacterium]